MGSALTSKDRAGHVTKWVQIAPACSALSQHLGTTQENNLGMLEVEVAPSYAFLLLDLCFPPDKLLDAI